MSMKTMSHKNARLFIIAAMVSLLGVTSLATAASAQTPLQPLQRISVSQLTSKLERAGYTIRDIDHKRYGWEVDVIDNNRQRLELDLDMQGNIISQEYDD